MGYKGKDMEAAWNINIKNQNVTEMCGVTMEWKIVEWWKRLWKYKMVLKRMIYTKENKDKKNSLYNAP